MISNIERYKPLIGDHSLITFNLKIDASRVQEKLATLHERENFSLIKPIGYEMQCIPLQEYWNHLEHKIIAADGIEVV